MSEFLKVSTSFDELDEQDLLHLIEEKVCEERSLEYKCELPSEQYDSKREFLADVSSLANSSGGYLLFGLREENGVPTSLSGMTLKDADGEILRLENLIRDGIEPRLQGVRIKSIVLASGLYAFVVFVPRSWSKPHVVNYKGHWRYYARNSVGKYPLDSGEVRAAILESGSLAENMSRFRDERLASIMVGKTACPLVPGPRLVLHLLPYAAFETASSFSLSEIAKEPWLVSPIGGSLTNARYNFDGFLALNGNPAQANGYTQVFRKGIIEAVDYSSLEAPADNLIIPSVVFERDVIRAAETYFGALSRMSVSAPFSICISLLGVSGYTLAVAQGLDPWGENRHPIDRDQLVLPEIMLEDYPSDVARALIPAFDALWNAVGWSRSLGYDENGEWGKGPNIRR